MTDEAAASSASRRASPPSSGWAAAGRPGARRRDSARAGPPGPATSRWPRVTAIATRLRAAVGIVIGSSVSRIAAQWAIPPSTASGGSTTGGRVTTSPVPAWLLRLTASAASTHWQELGAQLLEAGITETATSRFRRILEEARGVGRAHGMVGVRIIRRHLEGVGQLPGVHLIGTAIRRQGGPQLRVPFMSHLDSITFSKLLHGGYVPGRLVIGIGAWRSTQVRHRMAAALLVELAHPADQQRHRGGADARHQPPRERDRHRRRRRCGRGLDGLATYELGGESMLVELFLLGTAVRRYAKEPLDEPPLPIMRLR